MKRIHFIAIGGSAMHNLAIALSRKGYLVTGSDDEIFEPSKSRLLREGLLPETEGWNPERITSELEAVIVGMHARSDNPELIKAQSIGLKTYSYPEFLYEQSKDKIRLVIGGSHGKTTITAMLLHSLKKVGIDVDYMVGSQLEGFDCMVKLTDKARYMVLEGDEYLSSPEDLRPKFHLYQPHHAIISGIAWDHINVFPTFENYVNQFRLFCETIPENGSLIYAENDAEVKRLATSFNRLRLVPYSVPTYDKTDTGSVLHWKGKKYPLSIFGEHNLQNLLAAMHLASCIGVKEEDFLNAAADFTGAGKRLQKIPNTANFLMYKDFAHSPSKLKATIAAVKSQYANRTLIACMELHTFSSLNKAFLPLYNATMDPADHALVYFNPHVIQHKKLEELSAREVRSFFGGRVAVVNRSEDVLKFIHENIRKDAVLLMMSSGNFDGIHFETLGEELDARLQ